MQVVDAIGDPRGVALRPLLRSRVAGNVSSFEQVILAQLFHFGLELLGVAVDDVFEVGVQVERAGDDVLDGAVEDLDTVGGHLNHSLGDDNVIIGHRCRLKNKNRLDSLPLFVMLSGRETPVLQIWTYKG